MNRRLWIGALIALIVATPLLGRVLGRGDAKAVHLETVERRQVRAAILTSGVLVYERQALLSPEVIGRVSEVLIKEGDTVHSGQLLLRLDTETYVAQVEQRRAAVRQQKINLERQSVQLANQRRQWQRIQHLESRHLLDARRIDEERQALELAEIGLRAERESLIQAEALLNQTEELMAKTSIRAPMAGSVTTLSIKVGETAVPSASGIAGSSLLTIADPGSLITEVNVDEADIANVAIGQEVSVYTAAEPQRALSGRVSHIAISARNAVQGSGMRSFAVRVELAGETALALRPGMSCRAEIYVQTAAATLAVPLQAVLTNNAEVAEPDTIGAPIEQFVYLDRDGRAERRVVVTGLADDSYQEITSGLDAGDRIVIGPYRLLRHIRAGDLLADIAKRAAR